MPFKSRRIGQTDLSVTTLGVGTAPLGGNFAEITNAEALAVIQTAFDAGATFIDTAPFYGFGRSERATGDAIRARDYALSTKVGRLLAPGNLADPFAETGMIDPLPFHPVYDYSYDAVMRSFEDSQQRLGLERIDVLLAHDIGDMQHGVEENARHMKDLESGYSAMDELRRNGHVKAIGIGVNEVKACLDVMEIGDWDAFLLAGRYTLLEQNPLDDLLPACQAKGMSLIIGGPFNSGILVGRDTWNYAKAPPEVFAKAAKLEAICNDHNTPLAAAALAFPLGHDSVASVIPGARSTTEMTEILAWAAHTIPEALWSDLKSADLLHPDTPTPAQNPFL
ncbi:MAG: aldo/keto reductase [Boseongicola sp.]|nr:aldo/keto reductase [Boseongicola sp.]